MAKKKSPTRTTKPGLKKKSTSRKTLKKRPAKKPSKPTTVDGILKSFENERGTLNADLASARKKIETLTNRIAKMKTDLEKAKRDIIESEAAIETLDERRDLEVGALLLDKGINLSRAASASTPKPKQPDHGAPLFDNNGPESGKVAVEVSDGTAKA